MQLFGALKLWAFRSGCLFICLFVLQRLLTNAATPHPTLQFCPILIVIESQFLAGKNTTFPSHLCSQVCDHVIKFWPIGCEQWYTMWQLQVLSCKGRGSPPPLPSSHR